MKENIVKEGFTEQLKAQVKEYKDSLEIIKEYLSDEQIKSIEEVLNRLGSVDIW